MHLIEYFSGYDLDVNKNQVQAELDDYATQNSDGGIGLPRKIEWTNKKFDSYEEADSYIEDISCHRFYEQIAVQYRDKTTVKKTKKWIELENRVDELRKEYNQKESEFNFTEKKSEFVTCKQCGSKISVKYMHSNYCPVCHADMRSKTVLNQIEKAKDKLNLAEQRLQDEIMKHKSKMKYKWLVKIEFHC